MYGDLKEGMEKEMRKYEKAEIEIVEIDSADIILTSGDDDGGDF